MRFSWHTSAYFRSLSKTVIILPIVPLSINFFCLSYQPCNIEVQKSASARCLSTPRGGRQLQLCATPRPFSRATSPSLIVCLADCMPLSCLLKTIKINGGIECRWCIKKLRFSTNIWSWHRSLPDCHVWSTFGRSCTAYSVWALTTSCYKQRPPYNASVNLVYDTN